MIQRKQNAEGEYVEHRINRRRALISAAFGSGGFSVGSGVATRNLSSLCDQRVCSDVDEDMCWTDRSPWSGYCEAGMCGVSAIRGAFIMTLFIFMKISKSKSINS